MQFKDPSNKKVDLYMEPRSLIFFSGEVRYNWLHQIAQRKVDRLHSDLKFRSRRISMTFRKVKTDGPCRCKWPLLCDSQNKSAPVEMNLLSEGAGTQGAEEAKTENLLQNVDQNAT